MIKSKYISDIINLLIGSDDVDLKIRQQINFISDTDYRYTGSGLFVNFSVSEDINTYRIETNDLLLSGVKIASKELDIEGEANLFFKSGIIDYLEIWCYSGFYPQNDLPTYTLTQFWIGSTGKQLSTE